LAVCLAQREGDAPMRANVPGNHQLTTYSIGHQLLIQQGGLERLLAHIG
jgi:hypothetical protein